MPTTFYRSFIYLSVCFLALPLVAQEPSDTLEVADTTITEVVLGYYESPPFIFENEGGDLEGINIWMWQKIARELNIQFRLEKMPLREILSRLDQNSIDLTVNPLTVTSERSRILDFSIPFYVSHSSVVVRELSTWRTGLLYIYSFFSLGFLRAIFALFVIILIFGVLVWVFERRKNPEEFQPGLKGVASGIWWSAVTMTTVGYGDKSPRSFGGRLIALVWMFAAIIMISGFTASIASSLTVNKLSWNRDDIQDFKEVEIATVEGSATEAWLRKKFFRNLSTFPSLKEGLEALEREEVEAVVYDEPLLIYLLNKEEAFRRLDNLDIQFNLQFYSFAFSKEVDEELEDRISRKIVEITESAQWEVILSEYDLTLM